VRIVTLEIDDLQGMGLFHRIDGNHRLSASESVDSDKVNIQAPFCLILLNENDAGAKQQSIIFHNINSKGLALTSEENLKAILDNNKFSDEELTRDFGWTYLTAKKLVPEIDKDYLSALNHVFGSRLRSVLLQGLEFLASHGLLSETASINSIKQKLTVVNNVFKQEPRLQACPEIGLLVAFLYYAFKEGNELVLTSAFKSWVLRNHIDEIKDIDAASIVDVFNRVHASQIKIFMAMPYYSDEGVDAYNRALSSAVSTITLENPHLNLMNHPIMRTRSPTHDIIADILNKIQSSDVFIADITNNNANVLYEYGYARGQNKHCILLKKRTADQVVKSDYANDLRFEFDGDYDLESNLKTQIEHVLKAQGFEVK
jgi:nucleoside 2-deoxyribosyltransferase